MAEAIGLTCTLVPIARGEYIEPVAEYVLKSELSKCQFTTPDSKASIKITSLSEEHQRYVIHNNILYKIENIVKVENLNKSQIKKNLDIHVELNYISDKPASFISALKRALYQ